MQRSSVEAESGGRVTSFPTAHVFRPPRGIGAALFAAAAAAGLLLGLVLLLRGLSAGISFADFAAMVVGLVLLTTGALFAYWAYAIYDLRYVVDGDVLLIRWGLERQLIPVEGIERIVLGRKLGSPRMRGIAAPGYCVGHGQVRRLGEVLFYSSHRTPADLVYIITPIATYGISLSDARGLARTIQAAQELAPPSGRLPAALHRAPPLTGLLLDRAALLLATGTVLAFLVAAGYLYARYPALPLRLALPYPPSNGVQRLGQRADLLRLPLTALLWLLIGFGVAAWAHQRLRKVAYTMLAGTLFAEGLYAIAAIAAAH